MSRHRGTSSIGLAVIGCGSWGLNHLRVFSTAAGARLVAACDIDRERRVLVQSLYPAAKVSSSLDEVLALPDVSAVVIATPASTHFGIAEACLRAGKDVLCEKPLTLRPDECEHLTDLADAAGRILMVGHVYCFDAGIHALRQHLHCGQLGRLLYATSTRTNRGPVRDDVSVLYDLGCHDVAIFNYLLDSNPVEVMVRGARHLQDSLEDVVFLTLEYPGSVLVNVSLSWIAAHKTRQISLVGEHGGVEWDELATDVALRLTEDPSWHTRPTSGTRGRPLSLHSPPRYVSLPADAPEPLEAQAAHFLDCVCRRANPICDGRHATEVIRTLWRAEQALSQARSVSL